MEIVKKVEDIINSRLLHPGRIIYTAGNAATPQVLLKQLAADTAIHDVELLSILVLGDIAELFSPESCKRITHRIMFNGPHSRDAMNKGLATYQLLHLSDIPRQLKHNIKPDVVFLQVSGPDNGGNYSFGTTVEGVKAAVDSARANHGLVIAECNKQMPFVLGTTLHKNDIDYLIHTDYELPVSPVHEPDDFHRSEGEMFGGRT